MPIILSKTTNSTTSSTSTSVLDDYYITNPSNHHPPSNYNDDEETTTDDDSNYDDDDDDTVSLSTTGITPILNNDKPHNNLVNDTDTQSIHSSSSSTAPSSVTYLDNILAEEILHEYNDGDLQTLNALVNKLHEADVARRKKEEEQLLNDVEREMVRQEQLRMNAAVECTVGREGEGEGDWDEEYYDNDDEEEEGLYDGVDQSTPIRKSRQNNNHNDGETFERLNDADLPSEMPLHPPSFSPLHQTNNNNNSTMNKRQLSISSIDSSSLHGPRIEIVPTSQIHQILPSWNQSWDEERREWQQLYNESQRLREEQKRMGDTTTTTVWRRSYTSSTTTTANGRSASGEEGWKLVRRNRSAPNNTTTNNNNTNNNSSSTSPRSKSTYQNRYGRPKLITTSPNPIVTKSSKKIHRRHARYALTAGMMLGVRESVGGANGVECELESRLWEESEDVDGTILESRRAMLSEILKRSRKEQSQQQRIEVVLGPLKVTTIDTPDDDDDEEEVEEDGVTTNGSTTTSNKSQQYHEKYLTSQCERISKYKFSPQTFYLGSNTSEPLPHKYKFKVYAPVVFQRIRTLFGVDKQTFLHSICGKFNLYEFASNAKSGQFFFYSHDGRYMIKTLTYTEQKFLRLILPAYYRHLTRHPSTFLTHFYGLYRVCMPNADNTRLHFVIMRSVFHTEKKIDRVWDLKGSTVGRKSGVGESVLKDLDILEEGKKLKFKKGGGGKEGFLKQLQVDAAFLASMGIMDYSLLLGLHNGCDDDDCCRRRSTVDEQVTPTTSVNERKRLDSAAGDPSTMTTTSTELPMTNTPHRRSFLMRAAINGSHSPPKSLSQSNGGKLSPLKPSSPSSSTTRKVSSMSDLGIQGGTPQRPETYYCGIIDILQYYNARKMGETVMKKAAGGNADSISCVDPETYGKRFVKFIGDLVE